MATRRFMGKIPGERQETPSDFRRPSTPIQSGGSRGEFSDRLYTGRNPFIQPWEDDFSDAFFPRGGTPARDVDMPFDRAGLSRFGPPADIGFDRAGPSRRFGPPADIGFDRAGPSRFGPPADIGFDRAGPELRNYWQQLAEMGGYDPDPYDDEYGPFVPPSVKEMDIFGTDYGPSDEYDFDRKQGYENRIWGSDPKYVARGGIMSLRR